MVARQSKSLRQDDMPYELRRDKLSKALLTSFGAWKDKDHPELKKGTEAFIRSLRSSMRGCRAKR